MKKITVKKALEFNGKSDKSKKTFVNNLKKPKSKILGTGGNYWVRSLSAITKAFKEEDNTYILEKIEEIASDEKKGSLIKRTKLMYERNIDILTNFEAYDFSKLKPDCEINFITGTQANSIFDIKGISFQVIPSAVFNYKEKGELCIGAVLFIAKLESYSKIELAIICEALYRYLVVNYSKNHKIDPKYCKVMDVLNSKEMDYRKTSKGNASKILDSILDEIRSMI